MDNEQIKRIVEAALLGSHEPLSLTRLSGLFTEDEAVGSEAIARAIETLQTESHKRGIELHEVASGFRFQVARDVHPWVARLNTERPARYSRALLETLSLIAYRQPITRGEIEQIRGVVVSTNIIRTLEEREWIRIVGHRDVAGRPALYGTTRQFLDYFNLKALDELPPLSEIRDLDDMAPQFAFEPPAPLVPALVGIDVITEPVSTDAPAAADSPAESQALTDVPGADADASAPESDSKEHTA